jgi:hypothetical protein
VILDNIAQQKARSGLPPAVLIDSHALACDHRLPGYASVWGYQPSRARRKAVTRAMHSFVRRYQQFAITGGQGRRELYLYEADDPVSVKWAQMNTTRKRRNPYSLGEVLREMELLDYRGPSSSASISRRACSSASARSAGPCGGSSCKRAMTMRAA